MTDASHKTVLTGKTKIAYDFLALQMFTFKKQFKGFAPERLTLITLIYFNRWKGAIKPIEAWQKNGKHCQQTFEKDSMTAIKQNKYRIFIRKTFQLSKFEEKK